MGSQTNSTLSRDEARLLAVAAQRLDGRPADGGVTKAALLETIRAIGCVQLDTISVVSRSHETVLWSRHGAYDPTLLSALHYPDGALIEYWAHAAAIVPVEAFPYFRRKMAFYAASSDDGALTQEQTEAIARVRAALREQGPIGSRHFARPEGPKPEPWSWWGGKTERWVLDHLWSCGELMVLRREGFQRVYDLTERVMSGAHAAPLPTEAEQRRYFVGRALSALGVATPRWVADYFRTGRPHVPAGQAASELKAMEAEGLAHRVTVDGLSEPVWLSADAMTRLARLRSGDDRPTATTLLSPFDNLIWHRGRTSTLFDFDYLFESYVPAPKRRYGYYTLPILHRARLVGRLDPSYDRKAHVLTIKALYLEPGVAIDDPLVTDLAATLRDFTAFLGGGEIRILVSDPPAFAPALTAALR
jgi:uncharacterized protein YcaQ